MPATPDRRTYTHAAYTAIGHAVDHEPDFAGWLSHVLAAVAADRGSTAALVAGRPGSWEAADVLHLVRGLVGHNDEELAAHRGGDGDDDDGRPV